MSGIHQIFYGCADSNIDLSYLLVAGGGAGGGGIQDWDGGGGAGGGGGGVSYGTVTVSKNDLNLFIAIGEGAPPSPHGDWSNNNSVGTNGKDSTISGTFSVVSGGGQGGCHATGKWTGDNRGWGGAGGTPNGAPHTLNNSPANSNGIGAASGAGAVDDTIGLVGGNGYLWPFNGSYYGGGGASGGDYWYSAPGGLGGGGYGGGGYGGGNGTANTGGGGGGGGGTDSGGGGGGGGSGVAIFTYTSPTQVFQGGIVTSSTDANGTHWFHQFNADVAWLSSTNKVTGSNSYATPGTYSLVIPAGVTILYVKRLVGGGGGAGDGYASSDEVGNWTVAYGPGGGSGGYYAGNIIAVTPGETLTLIVGDAGLAGAPGGIGYFGGYTTPGGSAGGSSSIKRGSTILLEATGGAAGIINGTAPGGTPNGVAGNTPAGGVNGSGYGSGGNGGAGNGGGGSAAQPGFISLVWG